jgi:hypothetical protein
MAGANLNSNSAGLQMKLTGLERANAVGTISKRLYNMRPYKFHITG